MIAQRMARRMLTKRAPARTAGNWNAPDCPPDRFCGFYSLQATSARQLVGPWRLAILSLLNFCLPGFPNGCGDELTESVNHRR